MFFSLASSTMLEHIHKIPHLHCSGIEYIIHDWGPAAASTATLVTTYHSSASQRAHKWYVKWINMTSWHSLYTQLLCTVDKHNRYTTFQTSQAYTVALIPVSISISQTVAYTARPWLAYHRCACYLSAASVSQACLLPLSGWHITGVLVTSQYHRCACYLSAASVSQVCQCLLPLSCL